MKSKGSEVHVRMVKMELSSFLTALNSFNGMRMKGVIAMRMMMMVVVYIILYLVGSMMVFNALAGDELVVVLYMLKWS